MQSLRASIVFVSAAAFAATVGIAGAIPARAQDCADNPNALGTSRVLVLQPGELPRIGRMQYPETLPLADREVVLTFDDGPLPPYSNQILDILAAQCVKATFFLVGRMAHSFPEVVRRIYEAGHSVGTHSEDHPSRFGKLPVEKVRQEIDEGIADVGAALGDRAELTPFFRIPGLARSDAIEQELAARSLVVFGSDTVADDWHRIRPSDIVRRAMSRLQARGRGILLLHDIHPRTVAALPGLLKELKERGFHVVHVIRAESPDRIETAGEAPAWPPIPAGRPGDLVALPAPDAASFALDYQPWRRVMLADSSADAQRFAAAAFIPWPIPAGAAPPSGTAELPVPSVQDIGPVERYLGGGPTVTSIAE